MKDILRNNKLFKFVLSPIYWIRYKIVHQRIRNLGKKNPKILASQRYRNVFHKDLDWDNPRDLNEKINWLKFNTDLTEWARLSDKYRVREYVKERGREDLLVKLYGVWDNVKDIDFNTLPIRFVLKSNNGCGTVLLVEDKKELDIKKTRRQLNHWLKQTFGYSTAEPQYPLIKPLIIAEEYLENDNPNSNSLVDYKVFCLDGKPYCIMVCANRMIGKGMQAAFYDSQWNPKPNMLSGIHVNDVINIPKPTCLDELLKAAADLAKGHPFVRTDFYIVHNKVFFGEMTFTPKGGYTNTISYPYLLEMGACITLPETK